MLYGVQPSVCGDKSYDFLADDEWSDESDVESEETRTTGLPFGASVEVKYPLVG